MEDDDADSVFAPIDPNEPIDFSLVYALHTFVANLEGQVCVIKGDSLELLDDSNSYWWLVKCIKTDEIGYIPAENVETPFERLARLNKQRNVTGTLAQEDDAEAAALAAAAARERPGRRNVVFAELPEEIFDSDYDEEESVLSQNSSQTGSGSVRMKNPDGKKGFLSKLLKRGNSKKKNDGPPQRRLLQSSSSESLQPTFVANSDKEPINVLRIYAGNVDLKATFKSVALKNQMTASELVDAALKRFRVPGASVNEYYITVLHMDSHEKRLKEGENVYSMLEELRHKELPGISDFSHTARHVSAGGQVSSVRLNDDNIIKVIINKKLNLFEKNYHLIRIFMFDESDPTGTIRHYKTVGVGSDADVGEVVELAMKKFKLKTAPGFKFSLVSIIGGEEIPREDSEKVYPILKLAENSAEDIDFVLRRKWIGQGAEPSIPASVFDESPTLGTSLMDDLQAILQSRPGFLDETPLLTEGADGGDSKVGSVEANVAASPLMKDGAGSVEADGAKSPLGSVSEAEEGGSRPSTTSTGTSPGRGIQIASRTQSLKYDWGSVLQAAGLGGDPRYTATIDRVKAANATLEREKLAEMQGGEGGDAPSRQSGHAIPADKDAGGQEEDQFSTPRDTEPRPPSKSEKRASQASRRASQASQASSVHSATAVPSEPVPSVQAEQRVSGVDAHSESIPKDQEVSRSSNGSNASLPDSSSPTGPLPSTDSEYKTPLTSSPTSLSRAPMPNGNLPSIRSSRSNFAAMEEYLEEMLTGNANPTKLESIETLLRNSTARSRTPTLPYRKSSLPYPPPQPTLKGQYNDGGLHELLTLGRRKTGGSSRAPSRMGSVSSDYNGSMPRAQSRLASSHLKEVFDDLEADLDRSLGSEEGGRKGGKSLSVGAGAAKDGSGGKASVDSGVVLDKFKDVEAMLHNMQRDLDNILSSAVSVFQVSESLQAQ
ncbi:hypothetical protein HK104_009244 [Borealophlyctis nickersoniae]|nr:hypothetical protein HK104_009244 [Borealophlyctis nickersoniae]